MLLCGCDTANSQETEAATRPETETTNVTNQTESKMMTITLNNGVVMPQYGLGVYSIPAGEVTYNSVLTALKCGYRHIDTAHAYQNERSVGQAVKDSGISRDSIWNSLVETSRIKPQIVQIECHPYAQRRHWQEMAAKHDIKIECWFPLGGRDSKGEILRDPVINDIAKAHGMTPAQVIIRWHLQEGFSVIPGSSNPAHIRENIQTLEFTLTDDDMQRIRALDKEKRYFNMSYEQQKQWFSQWNPTD